MSEQDLGVSGLWTSPNPKAPRPPGAMDQAREVVFRRPQLAEPRPGFEDGTTLTGEGVGSANALIPYDGDVIAYTGTVTPQWVSDSATISGLSLTPPYIRAQEMRGNLYLTASDAMRKLTSASDDSADRLGLLPAFMQANTGGAGSAIVDQYSVAVRLVLRRTDANGLVIRSAPSPRSIANNTGGSDQILSMLVYLVDAMVSDGDVLAGDVLEVYRSYNAPYGTQPSDELYLALEHELTSANLSAGSFTITTDTVDADLGRALYTNSAREGIERRNIRPPSAKDVTEYQGSLFLANLTYPPSLLIRATEGDGSSLDVSGAADGIGYRTSTGTRTNASNVISGVADTTGLEVGMIYAAGASSGSWSGTDPILITNIAGGNVTVSETWNGSTDGAPVAVIFYDSIRVKSSSEDQYYPSLGFTAAAAQMAQGDGDRVAASALFWAYTVGNANETTDASAVFGARRAMYIEGLDPDAESFEVFATHGDEYEPLLPTPDQGSGEPSQQDVFPNGLTWSKNSQPEHFMRGSGHVLLIGDSSPILRVFGTKDALWILKGKGGRVYRLSGYGEVTGWRVDPDAKHYLLHPGLATVMQDSVYAWMDSGAARIDDGGLYPLSEPIKDQTGVVEELLDHTKVNYAFAVANDKEDEVVFGLPDETDIANATAANTVDRVLVFNANTQTWADWFWGAAAYISAMYDPDTRLLWFGREDDAAPRVERAFDPTASVNGILHADREEAVTISTINGNTLTLGGSPAIALLPGALIVQGSNFCFVTAEAEPDITVSDSTGFSTGAATAYEPFESRMRWLPRWQPSAALVKHFTRLITHWEDLFGVYAWSILFETPRELGSVETRSYTRTPQRSTFDERDDTDARPSRNSAKATQLYPSVVVNQADSRWKLSGIAIESEAVGRRVSR